MAQFHKAFEKLPAELRRRVYRLLLADIPDLVELAPDASTYDNWIIKYQTHLRCMDVDTLRAFSPHIQSELENEVLAAVQQKPFFLQLNIPHSKIWQLSPTLADGKWCMPEDRRSPYHKSAIYYATTWPGLVICALIDVIATIRPPYSCFTPDLTSIRIISMTVADLVHRGLLPFPHGACYHFIASDIQVFARVALMHVYASRTLQLLLSLPTFQTAELPALLGLIKDLRYSADNGFIQISVVVLVDKCSLLEWQEWLQCVGGEVTWSLVSQ